jgi:flagellar basal-body rod protein FlgB
MIRALFSAASGLQAQQMNVDVIANNIANSNTPGFKKDRINFQDLLYQTYRNIDPFRRTESHRFESRPRCQTGRDRKTL